MLKFSSKIDLKEFLEFKLTISISILFILIINLFLLGHPLTKVLGYEFSVINALLLTILTGIFTIRWLKKNSIISGTYITVIVLILFIPLSINIINSLFTEFCSFKDGILFYSVITGPSVFIGAGIAFFVAYLSDRLRYILFVILIFLIALIPVIEIYFYPQIYFYNPIIAYFPGSIYDEGLAVDLKLILYRFLNLIFIGLVYYIIVKDYKRIHRLKNSILVFSITILFFSISPCLGFSTNKVIINNLLVKKIETAQYIIHMDESINKNESWLISLFTEYYFQNLRNSIKETPSQQINIFIFKDSKQKRKYFGSESADVAKPWLYQIYLSQESWRETLKHEMAHIFSAEFGSTIFKLAGGFSPFLIEGFAMSQDPFKDNLSIDYLSAINYAFKEGIDLGQLASINKFFETQSLAAYIVAGSFAKFLIDNFGIDKFKEYYKTNDINSTYQIQPDSIYNTFLSFIRNKQIYQNVHTFYYYFGRQSITQKVCPRFVGRMLKKGWEQIDSEHIEDAKITFNQVLRLIPNYSALVGLGECLTRQDSLESAVNLFENFYLSFDKTPFYYLLRLRLADSYIKLKRFDEALDLYNQLKDDKPTISLELISKTRIKLLSDNYLYEYLTSDDMSKLLILYEINRTEYFYPSIPTMISLASSTEEDYSVFIKKFDKTFFITDMPSAFSVFRLSEYMIENFDFRNARKMAALSRRYRGDEHLNYLWNSNFEKAEWFYYNADEFLNQFNQVETK